uniref:Uncharacterized protein n=1 Tax=Rhizophora mucronata TaxID=61149 RepID=A0A2P2NR13_RHIMU
MEQIYPNIGVHWVQLLPLQGKKVYQHCGKALQQDYIASFSMEA